MHGAMLWTCHICCILDVSFVALFAFSGFLFQLFVQSLLLLAMHLDFHGHGSYTSYFDIFAIMPLGPTLL